MPTDDTSQNDSHETPETPAVLTAADVGNMVNQAVTAHLKRFAEKQLPTVLADAMKPFGEQIAALRVTPPSDEDHKGKAKPDPQIAALEQKLDAQIKATQAAEQKRAAAEEKARHDRAYSEFRNHLSKQVNPDMLDMVANNLFHIEKVVEVDDDGSAYFKSTRNQFGQFEDVRFPLKDGVDEWVKSDKAKPFLPAPGTSAAPTTRRQTITPSALPKDFNLDNATPGQRVQAAAELEKTYEQALAARGIKL